MNFEEPLFYQMPRENILTYTFNVDLVLALNHIWAEIQKYPKTSNIDIWDTSINT